MDRGFLIVILIIILITFVNVIIFFITNYL